MSHGPISVFTKTMSSFSTSTSGYDLGRAWKSCYLEVPSMTSNTELYIQGSGDNSTFRRTYHPAVNSSTAEANVFAVASSVTNSIIPIPNGFRYVKVEASAVVSFSAEFKIICSD